MIAPIRSFTCLCLFLALGAAEAAVRLPFVFTHHMVLQREAPAPVWGKADPGERVTVRFAGQAKSATADAAGAWRVTLDPLSVGEPRELTVEGSATDRPVVVRDVLVGDVWICSGQSNMQWRLDNARDGRLDLLAADRPSIRLLNVDHLGSQQPLDDIDQAWLTCTPKTAKGFSAVGYHFGAQLQETLGVPIGLIRNAWGGSACEAWLPTDALAGNELYGPLFDRWKKTEGEHDEAALRAEHGKKLAAFYAARDAAYAAGERLPQRPWVDNKLFHQHRPGNLYNARVAPLVPFAIKGVIWYQGESNAWRGYQYRDLFPRMIQVWRDAWGQGDFPFYWVQLADFQQETAGVQAESDWAELREAQTMTLDRLPNVGEAVTIDLGEANDIHPRNKRDVALRLARLALAKSYGLPIKADSPRWSGQMEVIEGKAVLSFDDAGEGLKTFDGVAPEGFTIAGEDRRFHDATAMLLDDGRIEVGSEEVAEPVAVRYGWAHNPVVNVYGSEWLPLTPFRTDDWPGKTAKSR